MNVAVLPAQKKRRLHVLTQTLFFCWNGVGILVYLLYGVRKSRLA
jgi:hypothetical protein